MKTPTLHSAFLALFGLIFSPLTAAYGSSPPADSGHLCQPVDLKPWQLDRLRPAGKRLAGLNVGKPRTVRLIYFLPNDRQAQPDIDATLDALMKDVQQSYAEQMENHGFGRRTFRFETDGDGKAVVHHVKGKFNDVHYHTDLWSKIWDEMAERFDLWRNIYLVTLDISDESQACGLAASWGPEGGVAIIPTHILHNEHPWACGNVAVIAHELGHTFGIAHDYFTNATRSPSSYHTDMMVTSFCAAEWLDAHRYFNIDQRYPAIDKKTTIRMLPPLAVPPNAIHLRFEVTDPDGLHQTQLHTQAGAGAAVGCQALSSKRATVEFVTHQVLEDMALRVVDVNGNVTYQEFPIDFTKILSPENVSIPDANLAAAVRETLGLPPEDTITQLDMLRLRELQASFRQITDLTGLEHAVNLIDLYLNGNQLRDISPIGGLNLLVVLELIDNRISNLSPLKQMNNLEQLWLSDNSVSDLSPLAGLTNLKVIWLAGNPIANTSPLHGLVRRNPYLEIDIGISLPHSLTKVSGDSQEGTAGVALAEPLVASVLDEDGSPLAGVVVTFSVSGGGGTLSSTTATTNANGRATTRLTLGSQPGTNTVVATVVGIETVTFTATAAEQMPHSLTKVSGDDQEGPASTQLAEPLVASVLDQDGSPLAGVEITFSVTAGEGMLSSTTDTNPCTIEAATSSTTVTTDANGQAATRLTLDSQPGTTTVEAIVAELDTVVTFTATAAEQATPHRLTKVCGDDQEGPAGELLDESLVVSVMDEDDAAMAGVVVSFSVTAGEGTLSSTTATTDANGRAATRLTLGSQPGTNTVEAIVAELDTVVTFTATGQEPPPSLLDLFGGGGKLVALPGSPQLAQNAPNPFNSQTAFSYFLPVTGPAHLAVFTLTGQRVAVLHQGPQQAGYHRLHWNGRDDAGHPVASGVYLYRLVTNEVVLTRKLLLLR